MSTVRFISDLHFGHAKARIFRSREDHDIWLIDQWNSVVTKRDLTWVLGDVAFGKKYIELVSKLNGVKHLILGNHDTYAISEYYKVFNKIHGFMKYKGFWLSHAPIQSDSLRGLYNIHGHTHSSTLINENHICVCVEALEGKPISLDEIKERL